MLTKEDYMHIEDQLKHGVYQKDIAFDLGVHPKTIRRALRRGAAPDGSRPQAHSSKLDSFKPLVDELLADGVWNAKVILSMIREQGYTGGYTVLRGYIQPKRPLRTSRQTVRFETNPGLQAQADWADLGTHLIAGKPTPLYLFVMLLGYSRAIYAHATTSSGAEAFLDCHALAFESFGGMPAEVLYDNAKVVVLSRNRNGARFNPRLLDFAGRFGFAPKLCRPYRAQTKGKVERSIGFIRDRFFVGRSFTGLDDLNQQLAFWLDSHANQRKHATTGERPIDRLGREKLLPFASARPWPLGDSLRPRPSRLTFKFVAPEVETRSLSVYEEACL